MIKLILFFSLTCLTNVYVFATTDKVLCYYASWAVYRTGNGKFTPEDIDANICTHVIYAFLGLEEDGRLKSLDEYNDIEMKGFERVAALKQINPNVKCILSVGGWNAGTALFNSISSDPTKRATLANSAIEYFQTYGFDGLDIDWEYPQTADQPNYIALLQDLKNAFQPNGYFLSTAVGALPADIIIYDVHSLSTILDVINVMTYDFHGSTAGITAQNSPLYASPLDGQWQRDNLNANSSISHWLDAGADSQKLAIGLAFYGHTFTLSDPNSHDLGAPSSGPGPKGDYTQNDGTLGYNEICEFHSSGTVVWDDTQKVPYLYENLLWVGYDNDQSIKEKVQYAKNKNLGGVMIWSIETDDLHGFCGVNNGLLNAIKENL